MTDLELTERGTVVLGFMQLRLLCDPRGHGVLDALENLTLKEITWREVALSIGRPPEHVNAAVHEELVELDRATADLANVANVVDLSGWSRKVQT